MTDFIAVFVTHQLFGGALRQAVVVDHLAIEGNALLALSTTTGVSISSIDVVSSTQLRVNFSVPVKDNPALTTLANYETSPALTLISIMPESGYAGEGPTYVDLVTSEQIDGQAYTFVIHNVEEAS